MFCLSPVSSLLSVKLCTKSTNYLPSAVIVCVLLYTENIKEFLFQIQASNISIVFSVALNDVAAFCPGGLICSPGSLMCSSHTENNPRLSGIISSFNNLPFELINKSVRLSSRPMLPTWKKKEKATVLLLMCLRENRSENNKF